MSKSFNICYNRISSLEQYGRKCHLVFIIFYSFSLSSQIKYLFLSSLWATRSLLHPLHSHRLFCSPLIPFALFSSHLGAITNFLSTISQIPSSLIYKISFTIFFFFPIFSLSPLYSISYTEVTWFSLVISKQSITVLFSISAYWVCILVLPIR